MLNENEIKEIIINSLYDKNIITKELYEKCGKPKVVQGLPGDLRTNDTDKLEVRLNAIHDKMSEIEKDLNDLGYETGFYLDVEEEYNPDDKYDSDGRLKNMSDDYRYTEYYLNDRVKWKKDIDKFEKEDKPRLERKLSLLDDAKKEWENIKNDFPDYETDWSDGWYINGIINHAKDYFWESGDVPQISVLQDESIPYNNLIKDTMSERYEFYFGDNYNTIGMDNKWRFKNDLDSLKKYNSKYGNLDNIVEIFQEVYDSPRKVQNEAKKYFIMKETYTRFEEDFQRLGGEDEANRLIDRWNKIDGLKKDSQSLMDETLRIRNKLSENGASSSEIDEISIIFRKINNL